MHYSNLHCLWLLNFEWQSKLSGWWLETGGFQPPVYGIHFQFCWLYSDVDPLTLPNFIVAQRELASVSILCSFLSVFADEFIQRERSWNSIAQLLPVLQFRTKHRHTCGITLVNFFTLICLRCAYVVCSWVWFAVIEFDALFRWTELCNSITLFALFISSQNFARHSLHWEEYSATDNWTGEILFEFAKKHFFVTWSLQPCFSSLHLAEKTCILLNTLRITQRELKKQQTQSTQR